MGAARQHVEHVFGADDGKQIGLGVAVQCGEKGVAARFQQGGAGMDHGGGVRHMLEHLHAGDDVVLFWLFFSQCFCRDRTIGELGTYF